MIPIPDLSVIPAPESDPEAIDVRTPGGIVYYHYGSDGVDDRGWGCGFRTLQTILNWIRKSQKKENQIRIPSVPELLDIVNRFDPDPEQKNRWIGTFEAGLVVEEVVGVSCRLSHAPRGSNLPFPELVDHFRKRGCPAMMGGDADAASKAILGTFESRKSGQRALLVADPHFWGRKDSSCAGQLIQEGWVAWKNLETDFDRNSFYNLCLPLVAEP